jgi:ribosomal protein L37AE/L43A
MIKLVKTEGGSNGAPLACKGCGSSHFIKSGHAWHCSKCGVYFPVQLSGTVLVPTTKANKEVKGNGFRY